METRATWLKAYAAERLPGLFEVVQVRTTPCDRCGGTGQVTKMNFRSTRGPGTNEWQETCPRCNGSREDRAIAYR